MRIKYFVVTKFSIPVIGPKRQLWIQAIEEAQEFDYSCREFDICANHFKSEDFTQIGKRGPKILRSDAVPSVFVLRENHDLCVKRPRLENKSVNKPCESCIKLTRKLLSAEEKIERLSKLCAEQKKELRSIKKDLEKFTNDIEEKQPNWLQRLAVTVRNEKISIHDLFV